MLAPATVAKIIGEGSSTAATHQLVQNGQCSTRRRYGSCRIHSVISAVVRRQTIAEAVNESNNRRSNTRFSFRVDEYL